MKYQIRHKLTKKPIRNHITNEIISFTTLGAAELFCEVRNNCMGASFYEIIEA